MNKIITNGMAPAHVPPSVAIRIVLVKNMVFTIVVDQPVGIVGPVDAGEK